MNGEDFKVKLESLQHELKEATEQLVMINLRKTKLEGAIELLQILIAEESKQEEEQTSKLYQDLAENMISDVMTEFQAGFIVPWHRWRYEHMKKVSEVNLRSEMGI